MIENQQEDLNDTVYPVEIADDAVENLFYGLPVGNTRMCRNCMPFCPIDCTNKDMVFLGLLWKLEGQFRSDFLSLTWTVKDRNENSVHMSED